MELLYVKGYIIKIIIMCYSERSRTIVYLIKWFITGSTLLLIPVCGSNFLNGLV